MGYGWKKKKRGGRRRERGRSKGRTPSKDHGHGSTFHHITDSDNELLSEEITVLPYSKDIGSEDLMFLLFFLLGW
uniref:Uncharacterized protein n=1 Tax=Cannabis sativa TaxID=3483 RepID=A0A803Q2D8_CANSA